MRPSGRIAAFVAAILTAFLGLVLVMLLVAIPGGNESSIGRNLVWALIAMLAGGALWGAWGALREAFVRPEVVLGDSSMRLYHPVVMKEPVELNWESIRAIAVSTSDDPGLWDVKDLPMGVVYEQGRLQWTGPQEESIAATEDFMRALVSVLDRDVGLLPNLAVVLNEPLDGSAITRGRLLAGGFRKTMPASQQTLGFLVTVRDPVAARAALEWTGLVRKLNWSDRALLEPREEDLRRLRRTEHLVAFAIAYGVLAVAHGIWEMVAGR